VARVSTVSTVGLASLTVINADSEHALYNLLAAPFDSRSEGLPRQEPCNQDVSHYCYYLVVGSLNGEIDSGFRIESQPFTGHEPLTR
jgi:hypothetical protein